MKIEILRWVLENLRKVERKSLKLKGKKPKLKEKTQNSRKKLKVWEALASYVYPSDVKKKCLMYTFFQILTTQMVLSLLVQFEG